MRVERIGDCTLYLADCLDVLPTLGKVDAVVTDPPYGIGEAGGKNLSRGVRGVAKDYGDRRWDDYPATAEVALCVSMARQCIVLGGNYYDLPPTSCWLVWDKMNGNSDFADCELAWTNLPIAVRRIRYLWNGMMRANKEQRGDHPTQKPVGVMRWCVDFTRGTVVDPFMGSGTTGVACVQLGRKFIGVEMEPDYFDIACERISNAERQHDLFIERPEQQAIDI